MSSKLTKTDKASQEVKLGDFISNLTTSIIKSKQTMDETSLEVAKRYVKDEILSNLSAPFFTIAEVNLQLKIAISEFDKAKKDFMVSVDNETLGKLPPHTVSEVNLKLLPVSGKLYKTSEGKTVIS